MSSPSWPECPRPFREGPITCGRDSSLGGPSKAATPWAPWDEERRLRFPRTGRTCPRSHLPVGQSGCQPALATATTVVDVGSLPAFGSLRLGYCEYVGANNFLIFFSSSWTVSLGSIPWSGTPAGRRGVNSSHSAIRKEPIYSSYQNRELTAAKPVLGLAAFCLCALVWASPSSH